MNLMLLTVGDSIDRIFYQFDIAIFQFFASIQNSFLTVVAKLFTSFGDQAFIIPMVILGIGMLFFKRTRKFGLALVFAILVGTILTNVIIKPAVLRIRPYNTLQDVEFYWQAYLGAGSLSESDYSFPSGHTTGAFEMAIAVFLVFWSEGKKKIAWVFPALALCTMGSRIYLMVHYPTDVLAGMIVGIVAGIAGYYIMKGIMHLISKSDKLSNADLAQLKWLKWCKGKAGAAVITVVVLAAFLYSFIPVLSEGGADTVRCAYSGAYDCYNAAKVDDPDYPPIDGKEYCKIHWKELMGENE